MDGDRKPVEVEEGCGELVVGIARTRVVCDMFDTGVLARISASRGLA